LSSKKHTSYSRRAGARSLRTGCVRLRYAGTRMAGIMAELAPALSLAVGSRRLRVYESADYRRALVCILNGGRISCSLLLARGEGSVLIELYSSQHDLIRTLPLCRRHFDAWFGAGPVAEEHSQPRPSENGRRASRL